MLLKFVAVALTLISLSKASQASASFSQPLIEMFENARDQGKKISVVIPEALQIRVTKLPKRLTTTTTRTAAELYFRNGKMIDNLPAESTPDTICVLSIWQGLIQKGGLSFDLKGSWTVFDITFREQTSSAHDQNLIHNEIELALWPPQLSASIVEQALYSITIIKKSVDQTSAQIRASISSETLRKCLGRPVEAFPINNPR